MTRRGLGRQGIDALLTSTDDGPRRAAETGVREVAVDAIRPNPFQPRRHIDEVGLQELAASITSHGLIQPLLVKADGDDAGFTLIAGERRWRAARLAGLEHVPVVVRDATDQQMLALAIIENVQRSDLNPIEAAEGFRRLMDAFGLTQADVADLVGKSRPAVANTVRLLGLPDEVRALVADGHLAEGHARALLAVTDADAQRAVARRAIAGGWTVRRVEEEVRHVAAEAGAPGAKAIRGSEAGRSRDPDTAAAEPPDEPPGIRSGGGRSRVKRFRTLFQIVMAFFLNCFF